MQTQFRDYHVANRYFRRYFPRAAMVERAAYARSSMALGRDVFMPDRNGASRYLVERADPQGAVQLFGPF